MVSNYFPPYNNMGLPGQVVKSAGLWTRFKEVNFLSSR